jgi:hypothetical protein
MKTTKTIVLMKFKIIIKKIILLLIFKVIKKKEFNKQMIKLMLHLKITFLKIM